MSEFPYGRSVSFEIDERDNVTKTTSGQVEQRLEELAISLPEIGVPAGNYVPFVRSGNMLFISGQVPKNEEGGLITGRVGENYSVEAARAIARRTGLHLLAVVRQALSTLDDVAQVVKITGFVNAEPGFTQHPTVINGCSDLLVEVFGEAGRHARAAVGVASLPGNVPVEIEGVFEVR